MTAIWSCTTAPPALFGPAAHSVDDSHSGGPGTRPTGFLPDFLTANLERRIRYLYSSSNSQKKDAPKGQKKAKGGKTPAAAPKEGCQGGQESAQAGCQGNQHTPPR